MSYQDKALADIGKLLNDSVLNYFLFHIDIYNFKVFNHIYGYDRGNELLENILAFLKTLPSCIYSERGFADQFYFLIATELPLSEELIVRFHRYTHEFLQNANVAYSQYDLRFWCGVCQIKDKDVLVAAEYANIARIKAKRENRIDGVVVTEEFRSAVIAKEKLEMQCMNALKTEQFFFHLQPQVDLKSGKILAVEVLARLKIDDEEIPPTVFVPIFERNGAIAELDYLIVRQVCQYLQKRRQQNRPLLPVSINLSSMHIDFPDSSEYIKRIIQSYDLPNELFCFEITEYNVIHNFERAAAYNQTQQECGFKTSVDDFGSGYTGLNIIRQIPISEIKLDKAFLDNRNDAVLAYRNYCIMSAIHHLAKALDVRVVCEGVETEEQRTMLLEIGFTIGQGFYFYRPCAPDEFESIEENLLETEII